MCGDLTMSVLSDRVVVHHNERLDKMAKEDWYPHTDRVPKTMEEWIDAGHTTD